MKKAAETCINNRCSLALKNLLKAIDGTSTGDLDCDLLLIEYNGNFASNPYTGSLAHIQEKMNSYLQIIIPGITTIVNVEKEQYLLLSPCYAE